MTVLLEPGMRLHPAVVYLPFVVPAAWKRLPGIAETGEWLSPLLLSPVWKVLVAFSLISLHSTLRASQRSWRPRSSPAPGSATHSVWSFTGKTCWRSRCTRAQFWPALSPNEYVPSAGVRTGMHCGHPRRCCWFNPRDSRNCSLGWCDWCEY